MELRDLEYFAVVAEHGNMSRAAEVLDLSPPALSKGLRRLENSLNAKLVKRTAKGVELTSVGSALFAQVRRIRLTLQDVAREAADLSEGRAGHLRIGTSAAIADQLPTAYAALLKEAPKLTVHVTTGDNDVMVPALQNGELDVIVNYLHTSSYEGLIQERLFEDVHVVCASANHRLSRYKRVTMDDLLQERWALITPDVPNMQWLHRAFYDRGLPAPRVALETRSLRLRLQVWASTDLLGFMSRRIIREVAPRFRLVEIPVKELRWRHSAGVIYRREGYVAPAVRRLVELLKQTTREIDRDTG
jgi:DNA-binding transcriptional LysR family regulator